MQANLLLSSLNLLNHIPGIGSANDFYVVFTKEGYAIVQSGIITARLNISLDINRSVALSWNRFSSFLKTLNIKNVEFRIEDDKLYWESRGPGYHNKGNFTYIDPITLMFPMDIAIPAEAHFIPTSHDLRDSFYFYTRSIDFDKYEKQRGIVLHLDPTKDFIMAGASDEKTLGLSEISDFENPVKSFVTEPVFVLIPQTIASIVSESEAHLNPQIFYSKNSDGAISMCGYMFENGFAMSGVESFFPIDFEKNKNRFVPLPDVPFIPFSSGISETISRMSIFDDGLDVSVAHFIQKPNQLIIESRSAYGMIEDSFDIPFDKEADLRCATKLLKKASTLLDGIFPIHTTNGTAVFTNERRSLYFIVSPFRSR